MRSESFGPRPGAAAFGDNKALEARWAESAKSAEKITGEIKAWVAASGGAVDLLREDLAQNHADSNLAELLNTASKFDTVGKRDGRLNYSRTTYDAPRHFTNEEALNSIIGALSGVNLDSKPLGTFATDIDR